MFHPNEGIAEALDDRSTRSSAAFPRNQRLGWLDREISDDEATDEMSSKWVKFLKV